MFHSNTKKPQTNIYTIIPNAIKKVKNSEEFK